MVRLSCLLACCLLGVLLLVLPAAAYPSANNYYRDEYQYEPEEIADMLSRINEILRMERKMDNYNNAITSEKRDFDMGLNRGFTGAIHAKHLFGVSAANEVAGPGRRRRDSY